MAARHTRNHQSVSGSRCSVRPFHLPYGPLGLPQPETERILGEHPAGFGVAVERPVALTSLEQNSDGIRVELLHSDNSTEAAVFRYVVGCEGAHSAVRRLLAIPFEGDHFPADFMLGDISLEYDLPRGIMLRAIRPVEKAAPDFFVAIPLPGRNRYRVTTLAPETDISESDHGLQTERAGPSIEELQAVADRLLPTKSRMSDLRWSSFFRISMRLAARYREGRGFIAGDAAHIHPPTGGQGMNTGIQDAYNLAWKMALVLKGDASPDLLDTYEAERRPVGADVVSRTRAQSKQFGRRQTAEDERLAETQVLVNYRASRLSHESVGDASENLPVHAGDRAPDCSGLIRDNVLYPVRLFDVIRGTDNVLLLYVGTVLGAQGESKRSKGSPKSSRRREGPGAGSS
jgi:2-polyprenyl-6-methoxyphenol hydroxylase-like FAD-dependent oxidoreductase